MSGSEYRFQSLETVFQQDLNTDGTTGVKTMPIETWGATRLDQVANEFYLHDSGGNGPALKYAGADIVAGQFGAWTPLGAEKVGGGYQVVWKNGSADQYIVWNVEGNGNYAGNATGVVSGTDKTLQNLETLFHQDLNGDSKFPVIITPIDGQPDDYFGQSVALSADGHTAVLGGYRDDVGANENQGSARVFVQDGGVWAQHGGPLTPSDGQTLDLFGNSVALSSDGKTAIVGGYADSVGENVHQGSARVFAWDGSDWVQRG